jgi:hypothetical protein
LAGSFFILAILKGIQNDTRGKYEKDICLFTGFSGPGWMHNLPGWASLKKGGQGLHKGQKDFDKPGSGTACI